MALGSTQPLTEKIIRRISWGGEGGDRRPVRRAVKLTTFMCQLFWNLGISTSWNPQGLSRPVMGLLHLLPDHQGCLRNWRFISNAFLTDQMKVASIQKSTNVAKSNVSALSVWFNKMFKCLNNDYQDIILWLQQIQNEKIKKLYLFKINYECNFHYICVL